MKLDCYSGQSAKFLVFRRVDDGEKASLQRHAMGHEDPDHWHDSLVRDKQGRLYEAVDPFDCMVLKKQDIFTPAALKAYADEAAEHGEFETASHMRRYAKECEATPGRKVPD